MQNLSSLILGVAAIGMAPPNLLAQQLPSPASCRVISDGTAATAEYRHVAAGDYSGHGYVDLAYTAAGEVLVAVTPLIHTAVVRVAPGHVATGLATLPKGGDNGRDALAIATDYGLWIWKAGELSQLDARAWGSVAAGDVDGNGVVDLIGRNPAGTRVQVVLRSSMGATQAAFALPGATVRAVATVQWDGVGGDEIAIATNLGLHVRSFASQSDLAQASHATVETLGLTALRSVAGPAVAWLARTANDQRILRTLRPGATAEQLDVGSLSPSSIWAADWDGDQFADLAIGNATSSAIAILRNRRAYANATSTFALPATHQLNYQPSDFPANPAAVWLGDFDADGIADDAAIARRDRGGLAVLRGLDAGGNTPFASGASIATWPLLTAQSPDSTNSGALPQLQWSLHKMNLQTAPATATHLELLAYTVRQTTDGTQSALNLVPQASVRKCIPLTSLGDQSNVAMTWLEPLDDAMRTFKFAVLRYRSSTRVWPPTLFAYAEANSRGWACALNDWLPNQTNWQTIGTTLQIVPDALYAATSGTIKPPPPPPPPSDTTDVPMPPDQDTGG